MKPESLLGLDSSHLEEKQRLARRFLLAELLGPPLALRQRRIPRTTPDFQKENPPRKES